MFCNVPPDPNVLLALQKKIVFNKLLRLIVAVRVRLQPVRGLGWIHFICMKLHFTLALEFLNVVAIASNFIMPCN